MRKYKERPEISDPWPSVSLGQIPYLLLLWCGLEIALGSSAQSWASKTKRELSH